MTQTGLIHELDNRRTVQLAEIGPCAGFEQATQPDLCGALATGGAGKLRIVETPLRKQGTECGIGVRWNVRIRKDLRKRRDRWRLWYRHGVRTCVARQS